jgi:hypothetical protein
LTEILSDADLGILETAFQTVYNEVAACNETERILLEEIAFLPPSVLNSDNQVDVSSFTTKTSFMGRKVNWLVRIRGSCVGIPEDPITSYLFLSDHDTTVSRNSTVEEVPHCTCDPPSKMAFLHLYQQTLKDMLQESEPFTLQIYELDFITECRSEPFLKFATSVLLILTTRSTLTNEGLSELEEAFVESYNALNVFNGNVYDLQFRQVDFVISTRDVDISILPNTNISTDSITRYLLFSTLR